MADFQAQFLQQQLNGKPSQLKSTCFDYMTEYVLPDDDSMSMKSIIVPKPEPALACISPKVKTKLSREDLNMLNLLITMDSDLFHSDSFMCGIFKGYPLYWPRIFSIQVCIILHLLYPTVEDIFSFFQK